MRRLTASIAAALLLMTLLAKAPLPIATAVSENPSSWAASDVAAAIQTGLVPEAIQAHYVQATTRAEFCALAVALYEKLNGEITGRKPFEDTLDSNVEKAAAVGIVNGVGSDRFEPDARLTREQAATMLARLAAAIEKPLKTQAATFADIGGVSSWAVDSVGQVQAAGIMSGVGSNIFAPSDSYTREQSIVTILRLYSFEPPSEPASGYSTLYPMSALVNGSYLWGYSDATGAFVLEPKYAYAGEWNGEYGIVSLPEQNDRCFVINRGGTAKSFYIGESEIRESFALNFNDGVPDVFFAGNCLYAESMLFSLSDGKAFAGPVSFMSYTDSMIRVRQWRGDTETYYDQNGKHGFDVYGQGGAFYEGTAVTWGRLIDKKGETVYEHDFFKTPEISVYGMGSDTFVGDLCVFEKNKKSPEGWESTGQYGVIRADGTVVLPAVYSFVRITPCKQILTGKPGETYRLHDASGKEIFSFVSYMTGAFYYDGTGHYMYRSAGARANGYLPYLVILSVSGEVTAFITVDENARHDFVSGLVRVTGADGRCRYYDVNGNEVLS